jgi:TrmH family RNA methyltransferase
VVMPLVVRSMTFITSATNPRISKLRALHTTRGRKKSGQFLLEGPNLLEAVLEVGMQPAEVYYQPELLRRTSRGSALLEHVLHLPGLSSEQLHEVSERVIEAIGETQTSQGVVCVLAQTELDPARLAARRGPANRPALVILDALADPGNMGTILRTALAADVTRVLLTPNCVDYYSPKVLRAAVGAHMRLPVETDLSWSEIADRVVAHCGEEPRVLLAEANSSHLYYDQDLAHPFALIIGNEAHGPSPEAHTLATRSVSIPLAPGVESLNAALATGIILFEAVRQVQKIQ